MNRRTFLAGALTAAAAGCLSFEEQGSTSTDTTADRTPGTATDASTGAVTTVDDGAAAWTADTMASVDGAPALGSETVYVHSSDRRLYALDRTTGDERWRTEIGEPPVGGAVTARPALSDDLVVARTDAGITALDRATGTDRWAVDSAGQGLAASPIPGADVVCHLADRATVRAVDRATGEGVWQTTLNDPVLGGGRADGTEQIVVLTGDTGATDCRLVTLSLSDGDERASTSIPVANELGVPDYVRVAADAVVTDADVGGVTAFASASGDRLWRREHDTGVTPPVTLADGTVYLKGFPEREVGEMAVDLQTGERRWQLDTGSGRCCNVSPAVADATTYIANTGGAGLVGVDDAGAIRWRYEGSAVPTARPAVGDDALYVPAADGRLYAIGL